jgi:hypothetical protein
VGLDINSRLGLFGRMLKVPILFNLSKEFIFHKTAVIITIKGDERVLYPYIGHEHGLFFKGKGFTVPCFDNYCI